MRPLIEPLIARLQAACREHCGNRLVSLVLFGSIGRGTAGPESYVDLLLVVEGLLHGRGSRVRDFLTVERVLATDLAGARAAGSNVELSRALKTPDEVRQGSAIVLDTMDDGRLPGDRAGCMQEPLSRLRQRLQALGARRVWSGNAWY